MIDRYRTMIETDGGKIHRLEDWGRRQLAYPIQRLLKAHYIMMNIECSAPALKELQDAFRFNDAVLRHLTVVMKEAVTEMSAIMKTKDEKPRRRDDDSGDSPTAVGTGGEDEPVAEARA